MLCLNEKGEQPTWRIADWVNNIKEGMGGRRLLIRTYTSYMRILEKVELVKGRFNKDDLTIFDEPRKYYSANKRIVNDDYYLEMIRSPKEFLPE